MLVVMNSKSDRLEGKVVMVNRSPVDQISKSLEVVESGTIKASASCLECNWKSEDIYYACTGHAPFDERDKLVADCKLYLLIDHHRSEYHPLDIERYMFSVVKER